VRQTLRFITTQKTRFQRVKSLTLPKTYKNHTHTQVSVIHFLPSSHFLFHSFNNNAFLRSWYVLFHFLFFFLAFIFIFIGLHSSLKLFWVCVGFSAQLSSKTIKVFIFITIFVYLFIYFFMFSVKEFIND
jgi:hypothetical protein